MTVSIVILVKTDYDIYSELLKVKLVGFKKVTVIVVVCTDTVPGA
jgi:hypothetical protein